MKVCLKGLYCVKYAQMDQTETQKHCHVLLFNSIQVEIFRTLGIIFRHQVIIQTNTSTNTNTNKSLLGRNNS